MYSTLLLRLNNPVEDYYFILFDHKEDILQRIAKFGQKDVAHDLGMPQSKLSAVKNMLEADSESVLYYITFSDGRHKIGITSNIRTRLYNIRTMYEEEEEVTAIRTWRTTKDNAKRIERHFKLKYKHMVQTKSSIETKTETFSTDILTDEDLTYIKGQI